MRRKPRFFAGSVHLAFSQTPQFYGLRSALRPLGASGSSDMLAKKRRMSDLTAATRRTAATHRARSIASTREVRCTAASALDPAHAARFRAPAHRLRRRDGSPGEEVETAFGRHFETEKLYERHRRHGSADIGALADLPRDLLDAISAEPDARGCSRRVGVSRYRDHRPRRRHRHLRVSGRRRPHHAGRLSRPPVFHARLWRGGESRSTRSRASRALPRADHLQRPRPSISRCSKPAIA